MNEVKTNEEEYHSTESESETDGDDGSGNSGELQAIVQYMWHHIMVK
jgi:hypothetical protein